MVADHHNHGHRVDIIDIPSPRASDDIVDFSSSSSDKESSWDSATDLLLTSWMNEARKASRVQLTSYYFYQRINNWITYPSILLSAFASIGTFATEEQKIPSLKFCLAAAAFVSGTLVAVNKQLRAAEKSQEHLLKAREFEKLIRDIEYIQSQRGSEALVQLKADFERITANQPQPPRRFKSFRDFPR